MKKTEKKSLYSFKHIKELMKRNQTEYADSVAYKFKEPDGNIREVSYGEFCDTVNRLGAALAVRGFGKSHIACVGENSYRWICAYLTGLTAAGSFQPVDKELPAEDMAHILDEGDAEVLFFSEKLREKMMSIKERLPKIKLWISLDGDAGAEWESMDSLISEADEDGIKLWNSIESDEYALKMLVYTSGTTGIAKGVMLSEHNLVSGVYYGVQVSQIYETALSILPYNHCYESVCDILVNIYYHSTLCINTSIKDIMKDFAAYHPTNIYIVPAIAELFYKNIMRNMGKSGQKDKFERALKISRSLRHIGIDTRRKLFKQIHRAFGGNLRKIVCGGAPIRPEIGELFDGIGIVVTGGYGITECSPLVSVNDESDNSFNTAGHRLPCIEWRTVDNDKDGIGEIEVKGDVVMMGYYKNPSATLEAFDGDWFRTGDYGYITDDDQIVITGRKKNIIVLDNGKNVYPEELENRLSNIECITEVVVRGLKNEKGDEHALMAEVYCEETPDAEELRRLVKEATADLPKYKQISKILLRSEPFPKTVSRKIKRTA